MDEVREELLGESHFEELLNEHHTMLSEKGMDERGVLACLINCTMNVCDQESRKRSVADQLAMLERLNKSMEYLHSDRDVCRPDCKCPMNRIWHMKLDAERDRLQQGKGTDGI